MALYTQFSSVFNNFSNDTLLSTTLGNTIIEYFNSSIIFVNASTNLSEKSFHFECVNNSIEEIIAVEYYYDIPFYLYNDLIRKIKEIKIEFSTYSYLSKGRYYKYLLDHYDVGNFYYYCHGKNSCNIELKSMIYENDLNLSNYYTNKTFIISYSCRKKL